MQEPAKRRESSLWTAALVGLVVVAPVLTAVGFGLFAPRRCIVEGMEIDAPRGPVRIEDLVEGSEVWTLGPAGARERGRVASVQEARASAWLEIALENGTVLRATALHPVATPSGWKEAGRLRPGDRVRTRDATPRIATVREREGSVRVFDLEVEPNPNFFAGGVLVHNKSSNRRNASASLKTVATANVDFRANDRDGNGANDFWVGDVSGLYRIHDGSGQAIKLIEVSIATADRSPRAGIGGTRCEPVGPFSPKAQYVFRALAYYEERPGVRKPYDSGNGRNPERFGFIAVPHESGRQNSPSFIINEGCTIYQKDLRGATVDTFPFDPLADGWSPPD